MKSSSLSILIGFFALSAVISPAAEKGFGIIAEGSPYSTIPSSALNQVQGYQSTYKSYQAAAGFLYGDPLGGHFVAEGVWYDLNFTVNDQNGGSNGFGTIYTADKVRMLGGRGGYHFNFLKRDGKFSIGFDLLGGVGQLSGNIIENAGGSLTTVTVEKKWNKLTGLSIVPLVHIGPTVTFPITNKGIYMTVGVAMDIPAGIALNTKLTFAPNAWRH